MDFYKHWQYQLILVAITIALGIVAYVYIPEFVLYFWDMVHVVSALTLFIAFDKVVFKTTNTKEQIVDKQNIAYGLVLLAVAIIISTCFLHM